MTTTVRTKRSGIATAESLGRVGWVGADVPLPTLLSLALVAYTIEFDNEAEHLLPHHTTSHGATDATGPRPWLVSMVMWFNCMKFVGPDGVQLGELERLARTRTNLDGMRRWRYVDITPGPKDRNPKRPGPDAVLRATAGGRKAQQVWGPLFGVIDDRWQQRFGAAAIADLRAALSAIADRVDFELPECLPILGYGLFSADRRGSKPSFQRRTDRTTPDANLPLSTLLSRVLLAFAIDFEYVSPISLAMSQNVLRVLDDDGVPVRDLPTLTGVSKEAVAMSTGYLDKHKLVTIEPLPRPERGQRVRLTHRGHLAQRATAQLLANVEGDWERQFGTDAVRSLRSSLEPLVGDGMAGSPLFAGLTPYPDGMASRCRRAEHVAALPDGAAPRRISRRKLTRKQVVVADDRCHNCHRRRYDAILDVCLELLECRHVVERIRVAVQRHDVHEADVVVQPKRGVVHALRLRSRQAQRTRHGSVARSRRHASACVV